MMEERDKDIRDVRKERNEAIKLLKRLIHATRPRQFYVPSASAGKIRQQAAGWIERKGFGDCFGDCFGD